MSRCCNSECRHGDKAAQVSGQSCIVAVTRGGGTDNPVTGATITQQGRCIRASNPVVQTVPLPFPFGGFAGAFFISSVDFTLLTPCGTLPIVIVSPENRGTLSATANVLPFTVQQMTATNVTPQGFTIRSVILLLGQSQLAINDFLAASVVGSCVNVHVTCQQSSRRH